MEKFKLIMRVAFSTLSIIAIEFLTAIESWLGVILQLIIGIMTIVYLFYKIRALRGSKIEFERKGKKVRIWRKIR